MTCTLAERIEASWDLKVASAEGFEMLTLFAALDLAGKEWALEFGRWLLTFDGLSLDRLVAAFRLESREDETINYTEVRRRIRERAIAADVTPPVNILSEDGGPHKELVAFATTTSATLDWLILGEA